MESSAAMAFWEETKKLLCDNHYQSARNCVCEQILISWFFYWNVFFVAETAPRKKIEKLLKYFRYQTDVRLRLKTLELLAR